MVQNSEADKTEKIQRKIVGQMVNSELGLNYCRKGRDETRDLTTKSKDIAYVVTNQRSLLWTNCRGMQARRSSTVGT